MIEGTPSQTALMVAVMRAHHFESADEPKILRDKLAGPLAGFNSPDALAKQIGMITTGFSALSDDETAERFVENVSQSVCMRSRLVEDRLQAGLTNGLMQLVVLGAGLDSTAYRLPEFTKGLQIYEVDHPSTQGWKRQRLSEAGVNVPDNLAFVPYDFENQTLAEALMAGGVVMDKQTLFSWLGVQPYLTPEAVRMTLSVVASFPRGSEIVMDFVSPDYSSEDDLTEDGLKELAKVVSKMGEPFLSHYSPDELKALLLSIGFSETELPSPSELSDRFLGGNRSAYIVPGDVNTLCLGRV